MVEMTLTELAGKLGGELVGDGRRMVRGVAPIDLAGADQVTFLSNQRYEKHLQSSQAAAVIVASDYAGPGVSLIRCKDAYFAFRQAMVEFFGFRSPHFAGVDDRASVDPSAHLGDGVKIGPHVTVAQDVMIGDRTVLYPGVYVGPRCRIGRDCTVYPNVTIYDGCVLGDRVTVHANSSIGQDGFGYATYRGKHEKIPQAGYVVLEDDVEIGACCAIDRATMGPTIVGAGTKFSNLVAIGHGTQMGKGCLVVAQAGIAGSVQVGNYCVFAGQSGVVGHIRIGDGVRIAAQSGVTNDVEAGSEVLGSPALPRAQARRAMLSVARLPQLRTEVQRLTRELDALKRSIGSGDGHQEDA